MDFPTSFLHTDFFLFVLIFQSISMNIVIDIDSKIFPLQLSDNNTLYVYIDVHNLLLIYLLPYWFVAEITVLIILVTCYFYDL